MAASPDISVRQSILLSSAKNATSAKDPEDDSGDTPTKDRPRKILDRDQELYLVYNNDGLKKTAYHVVDFAGFYPIWLIVEFLMTPTGASKDKIMVSFTRCVTALSTCSWDAVTKVVISPRAQIEKADIAEFKQQD